ncbi:MAG: biosynthetic-type acetolactate synthase large subunit [Vulcanimicrobiaceae bacterium]
MKLSDYVMRALAEYGVRDIFLVSGGGIMHLLDSLGRTPQLRYYATYHEQAAVAAAEGYARRTGRLGVALVTVGPGAANAVSALPGAWVDSIPLLVLSGQVRSDLIADYAVQRQRGPQEANTLDMARPVTKYAARVLDPATVRAELERAIAAATTGRPGPTWLEFPVDITALDIDPERLAPAATVRLPYDDLQRVRDEARQVADELRAAERPLLVVGNGVRLGRAEDELRELMDIAGIPVVVPFTAKDIVAEDDPLNAGVFGTAGQRRGNFAVQNADVLLGLGAGFNVQKMGFNVAGFAPKARKIVVDIDEMQLHEQALEPDVAVLADVGTFMRELVRALRERPARPSTRWRAACKAWSERYPLITPDYFTDEAHVNSYVFMDALASAMRATDTFVSGAGLDVVSAYQAFRVKRGQRVLLSGWGSMGWDLPLSIGACVGSGGRVVNVTGDGSFQWNSQELLTIKHYGLPIKIFIFNNAGFSSIRATQNNFFDGRFVGADPSSGVSTADFAKLAEAYGLAYARIENNAGLDAGIGRVLQDDRATICEVLLASEQTVSPKASAFRRDDGTFESRPLEDMSPFLPREEVYENMHLFDDEVGVR